MAVAQSKGQPEVLSLRRGVFRGSRHGNRCSPHFDTQKTQDSKSDFLGNQGGPGWGRLAGYAKTLYPWINTSSFIKGRTAPKMWGVQSTDWSNLHALQRYKEPACSKPFITTFCSRCFLPFPLQTSTRVNSSLHLLVSGQRARHITPHVS